MPHGHTHTEWRWTCSMDMDLQHGHMNMQYFIFYAKIFFTFKYPSVYNSETTFITYVCLNFISFLEITEVVLDIAMLNLSRKTAKSISLKMSKQSENLTK
jgi:hypothetical protein